ncbi:MAG: nickel pincer cofactor biosynthesis protein LarB [Nitrospirae bacterium]|uniref:nickel pincer cofactor biosynthesis protein LarB n=1 Tax=Candidatus Magnetobacterium casense TaxID=1455061 RepID=UPI00058AFAC1|nr:nickel pincer cofactor biosynthesis protein LarB [Candidatus Magnetobacterium casensis]MBF0336772.1 nickel pincer cofactor biosynthesis protein LarB [Nitrospirota bacterium]
MDRHVIEQLLVAFKEGRCTLDETLNRFRHLPYEDIGFARIDHHRQLVSGITEVVYGQGKGVDEVIAIARRLYDNSGRVLITRTSEEVFSGLAIEGARFYPQSRIIMAGVSTQTRGHILVVSAGTSDIAVAEEAELTATFLGSACGTVFDIGVAGLHRVISNMKLFDEARVIVVVAGMEGALPSVIGGLTSKPLVAVPTSQGYGTNLGGLTALFAMLNSCVPGIAVVNIDNGFGAGCLAHKINMIGL